MQIAQNRRESRKTSIRMDNSISALNNLQNAKRSTLGRASIGFGRGSVLDERRNSF